MNLFPASLRLALILLAGLSAFAQPSPVLRIESRPDGLLRLSWTNAATGFVVEHTDSLNDTNLWIPLADPFDLQNGSFAVSLNPTNLPGRFFRLHRLNLAPMLGPVSNQTVPLGSTLALQLTGTDSNGDALSYSAQPRPLPANAALDGASGLFTFKPAADQVGAHVFTFSISDGLLTDAKTITVDVPAPPAGGLTGISGRILDTTDFILGTNRPVVGVRVTLLGHGAVAFSDTDGFFLLTGVPGGLQVLDLDISTAAPAPDGSTYAGFREEITLIGGVTNSVSRPFFLPRQAMQSVTIVNPAGTTIISNAALGITLTIPPGTAKLGGTNYTGPMSISLVPNSLAPAALPDQLQPGLLITIQPVGVTFSQPVPITFPNSDNLPPNSDVNIWSLDAGTGMFVIVGRGRVSADGLRIVTVSGGMRATDWHFPAPPDPPSPPNDPPMDDDSPDDDECEDSGSLTTLGAGKLIESHSLASYRSLNRDQALRLVYDSLRAHPQPILRTRHLLAKQFTLPTFISTKLTVAGIEQPGEMFHTTSGLSEVDDEEILLARQFDASDFDTGIYPYRLRIGHHNGSSAIASFASGQVMVNNESRSPFGAGWTLAGVERLHVRPDAVLLTTGDGGMKKFTSTRGFSAPLFAPTLAGFRPEHLAAGDFNRDGKLDLLVGSRSGGGQTQVELLLGNGLGSFSSSTVQTAAPQIVTADFNGDGKLDFAAGNQLFAGDGAGGFAAPITLPFGGIRSVFDFNRDRIPDLLNANTVFLGDGTGAFPRSTNVINGRGEPAAVADFNRDGSPDVAMANGFSQGLVFHGDGGGGFIFPWPPVFNIATLAPEMCVGAQLAVGADVNGDGNPDLITLSTPRSPYNTALARDCATLMLNDNYGTFLTDYRAGHPVRREISDLSALALGLVAADLDGDGRVDLAVPRTNGLVTILLGNGAGDFRERKHLPAGEQPSTLAVADGNSDGLIDLLVANAGATAGVSVIFGQPFGGYRSPGGDASTLTRNPDLTFTRQLPDGTRYQFSSAGLLVSVTDRNNNVTQYAYDPTGRLTAITDPVGLVTTFAYADGFLSSITDPANRVTAFEHDAAGNLTRLTDPDGTSRRFAYDAAHRMIEQVSKRGFTNSYTYNFAGRNTFVRRADGSTRVFEPSECFGLVDPASGKGTRANPAPITRPAFWNRILNFISSFTRQTLIGDAFAGHYDGNGNRRVWDIDAAGGGNYSLNSLGQITRNQRDDLRRVVSSEDPAGITSQYKYDERGNVVEQAVAGRVERFFYEAQFNQLLRHTNSLGAVTAYELDARGNVTAITNALGHVRRFTCDARGLVLTRTDENDKTTTFTHDARGNLEKSVDPLGIERTFERDSAGNVTFVLEGNGARLLAYDYDEMNRRINATDGLLPVIYFDYDEAGNLSVATDALGLETRRFYDAANRLIRVEDPFDGTSGFSFDGNGNLVSELNAAGALTRFAYDAAGRMVRKTNALGGVIEFTYDAGGNTMAVRDEEGRRTTLGYDTFGKLAARTNALGQVARFQWDSGDRLARADVPGGGIVFTSYDDLDRLTFVNATDATGSSSLEYEYDPAGNPVTQRVNGPDDFSLESTYTYDGLNRIVTASQVDLGFQPELTLTYAYDEVGNLETLADSLGGATLYEYDPARRVTRATDPANNLIDFTYDAANRLTRIAHPGGLESDYVHGQGGLLEGIVHRRGATELARFDYTHNTARRLSNITGQGGALQFTYDLLGRLLTGGSAALPENYSYSAAGNRTASHLSASHVHDAAHRLIEDGQFFYTYNANGNLATKTSKTNNAVTTYAFNALNRLVQIDFPDGTSAHYRYDALGRRVLKSVNGATNHFVFDSANNPVLELDAQGQVVARNTFVPGRLAPVSRVLAAGSRFPLLDQQGSVRAVADAGGNLVTTHNYDSFGSIVAGSAAPDSFGFTGHWHDAESGFIRMHARYYAPRLGRFVSEDPVGFGEGTPHPYAYARSDPVNRVDPDGAKSGVASKAAPLLGPLVGLEAWLAIGKLVELIHYEENALQNVQAYIKALCNPKSDTYKKLKKDGVDIAKEKKRAKDIEAAIQAQLRGLREGAQNVEDINKAFQDAMKLLDPTPFVTHVLPEIFGQPPIHFGFPGF